MADADPLISVAAAAKRIGVNRSTLGRQIADGSVRSHRGKVRLSEVLEDRARNIDLTRSRRRDGALDHVEPSDVDATSDATIGADATRCTDLDATDPVDAEPVLVDGQVLPYAEARALKETYLGRLRKLEFEKAHGALVEVEEVGRLVEREYSLVRTRLLSISGKIADRCAMQDRVVVARLIENEIHEALAELSASDAAAGKVG
jgi:hypothetical protein